VLKLTTEPARSTCRGGSADVEADRATALVARDIELVPGRGDVREWRSSDSTGCSAAHAEAASGKTMSTLSITPPPAAVSATPTLRPVRPPR
jgi:hypothetical protein